MLAIVVIVLTVVLWVFSHKHFRFIYFGNLGNAILGEILTCFFLSIIIVAIAKVAIGSVFGKGKSTDKSSSKSSSSYTTTVPTTTPHDALETNYQPYTSANNPTPRPQGDDASETLTEKVPVSTSASDNSSTSDFQHSQEWGSTDGWDYYLGTWKSMDGLVTMTISPSPSIGQYQVEIGSTYYATIMIWTYEGTYRDNRGIIECSRGTRTNLYWNDGMRVPETVYDQTGEAELEFVFNLNGNKLRWINMTDDLNEIFHSYDLMFERYEASIDPEPESFWFSLTLPFLVQTGDLPIYTGPGSTFDKINMTTGVGVYTIVEVSAGPGSKNGWGKLKSGAGWINLDDCSLFG